MIAYAEEDKKNLADKERLARILTWRTIALFCILDFAVVLCRFRRVFHKTSVWKRFLDVRAERYLKPSLLYMFSLQTAANQIALYSRMYVAITYTVLHIEKRVSSRDTRNNSWKYIKFLWHAWSNACCLSKLYRRLRLSGTSLLMSSLVF